RATGPGAGEGEGAVVCMPGLSGAWRPAPTPRSQSCPDDIDLARRGAPPKVADPVMVSVPRHSHDTFTVAPLPTAAGGEKHRAVDPCLGVFRNASAYTGEHPNRLPEEQVRLR